MYRHGEIHIIEFDVHAFILADPAYITIFLFISKGQLLGLGNYLFQFLDGNFVIGAEYKILFLGQVLTNLEFGIYIVLKIIIVAVQMIRGDIEQNGNVSLKFKHPVQLEAAKFQYKIIK